MSVAVIPNVPRIRKSQRQIIKRSQKRAKKYEKGQNCWSGSCRFRAAWQLARLGIPVELIDIKPGKMTPAHKKPYPTELVWQFI